MKAQPKNNRTVRCCSYCKGITMGDNYPERCASCLQFRTDILRCGKCHSSYYCQKECQVRDWPVHKLFCGRIPNIEAPPPIRCLHKSYSVQALLLPQDAAEPKLVPVEIPTSGLFNVDSYVPGGPRQLKIWSTEDAPQHVLNSDHYYMPFGFFVLHNHFVTIDPTKSENVCTKAVIKARAKVLLGKGTEAAARFGDDYWKEQVKEAKRWKGNVLLLKTDRWKTLNKERGPTFYDVEMKDIPDFVKAFWIYTLRLASR